MGKDISIKTNRGIKNIALPTEWPEAAGLIFIKANEELLMIPAQASPSSLTVLGRQGARKYFNASECRENAE